MRKNSPAHLNSPPDSPAAEAAEAAAAEARLQQLAAALQAEAPPAPPDSGCPLCAARSTFSPLRLRSRPHPAPIAAYLKTHPNAQMHEIPYESLPRIEYFQCSSPDCLNVFPARRSGPGSNPPALTADQACGPLQNYTDLKTGEINPVFRRLLEQIEPKPSGPGPGSGPKANPSTAVASFPENPPPKPKPKPRPIPKPEIIRQPAPAPAPEEAWPITPELEPSPDEIRSLPSSVLSDTEKKYLTAPPPPKPKTGSEITFSPEFARPVCRGTFATPHPPRPMKSDGRSWICSYTDLELPGPPGGGACGIEISHEDFDDLVFRTMQYMQEAYDLRPVTRHIRKKLRRKYKFVYKYDDDPVIEVAKLRASTNTGQPALVQRPRAFRATPKRSFRKVEVVLPDSNEVVEASPARFWFHLFQNNQKAEWSQKKTDDELRALVVAAFPAHLLNGQGNWRNVRHVRRMYNEGKLPIQNGLKPLKKSVRYIWKEVAGAHRLYEASPHGFPQRELLAPGAKPLVYRPRPTPPPPAPKPKRIPGHIGVFSPPAPPAPAPARKNALSTAKRFLHPLAKRPAPGSAPPESPPPSPPPPERVYVTPPKPPKPPEPTPRPNRRPRPAYPPQAKPQGTPRRIKKPRRTRGGKAFQRTEEISVWKKGKQTTLPEEF